MVAIIITVLAFAGLIGFLLWQEQRDRSHAFWETENTLAESQVSSDHNAGGSPPRSVSQQPLNDVDVGGSPRHNLNQQHLTGVRSRSCYPGLRGLHGFITFVAIAGCVVLWLVLMNVGNNTADRIYATFVCALVIVGAILEYGLFTLIVDAVDVLIDNGRRESERK